MLNRPIRFQLGFPGLAFSLLLFSACALTHREGKPSQQKIEPAVEVDQFDSALGVRFSIVEINRDQVIVAAGSRVGILPGQALTVVRPGRQVKEPSTGTVIELPGEEVGRLEVISQFRTGMADEGSICKVLSGSGFALTDYVELPEPP